MPLPYQQPMQISTFTGGVTDVPNTGNPSQAQRFRNFMPDKDNTVRSRNGSKFFDLANKNYAGSAIRIGNSVSYNNDLFAQVVKDLKYVSAGSVAYLRPAWNLVTGQIYSSGTVTAETSFHEFNKHLFTSNDAGAYPMVIVKDDSLVYRARTVGLPPFPKSRTVVFTSANVDTAGDYIQNPDTMALVTAAANPWDGYGYVSFATTIKIRFSTTGTLPAPLVAGTDYYCTGVNGKHWFRVATSVANAGSGVYINLTDGGTGTHSVEVVGDRQASVGMVFSDPAIATANPENVWLYYLVFYYQYETENGDTNEIYGGTLFHEMLVPTGYITNTSPSIRIINIPKIGPGAFDIAQKNYDTSGVRTQVRIYRTQINGIVPYLVGSVTNGATTFDDNVPDFGLDFSGVLYTDGGVLNNDIVERYTYATSANDFLFAGDITENIDGVDVRRRNRVCQSKPFEPENVMTGLFVDLAGPVTGLGSLKGFPIAFTEDRSYRIEGTFDGLGQGGMALRDLSTVVGCVSHNSIVSTPSGLYWAGKDGFYVSNGSGARKISRNIDTFYKQFTSSDTRKRKIKGCYDHKNKIVYWSVCSDLVVEENNEIWMFDEDTGLVQSGLDIDASFYHWDNDRHFKPTSICVHNDNLIRGDARGFVFEHDEDYRGDVYISSTTDSFYVQPDSNVAEIAIPFDYISCFYGFGSLHMRKWVNELKVYFQNVTSLGVDIYSSNDGSSVFKRMTPVQFLNGFVWGAPWVLWGFPLYIWGDTISVIATRSFPRGQRRCETKQVQFKALEDSLVYQGGTVTITGGNTATIGSGAFSPDLVGYYLYLSSDAGLTYPVYVEIVGQSVTTVLNLYSSIFLIPNGVFTYQIRGTRKEERIRLLSYSLGYAAYDNAGATKKDEAGVRN